MTPPNRRTFLKQIGQAGLFYAASPIADAVAAFDPGTVQISILHTTDLHGHILPTSDYSGNPDLGGFARCASQIRRWRRQNRNSILIDVGDVYQGTEVSLRNKGELMIDLFNHFKYDAWVVGNHEFDWGVEVFENAIERSKMAVLATNVSIEGKLAGQFADANSPFSKIRPLLVREFEGIKIAIIGVTTPGMSFWFRPEFTRGLEFPSSVEAVRRAIAEAKSEGADAIILAGHMGLKLRSGGDDFANNVVSLTSEFPETVAFIAGHTHQLVPNRLINGILLTQADHFGIHVGRVDLIFDRESKKLLARSARCELMNSAIRLDHTVLSRAKSQIDQSTAALAEPIGQLADRFHSHARSGQPSDIEKLIAAAIVEALQGRQTSVDGVFHGVFDENIALPSGPITVNDIWNIIPYENYLVTGQLTPDELKAVMEEAYASREERNLMGFNIVAEGRGSNRRIVSMSLSDGRQLERERRYTIAFNTFDSRSGGHHFMMLRTCLEQPESACTFHPVQTRDALIDYFRNHHVVHKIASHWRSTPIAA